MKDADRVIFGAPLIDEAAIEEVVATLRSGWIGPGPRVERFEQMLAEYLEVDHVVCVASGTAAIYLILRALGIGRGDEVLLPTMTFVSCAQAIELTGAVPVPIDSDPDTYLMSLDRAQAAITDRTKAVLAVHLAGRPLELDRLERLCAGHGLLAVEDAAHALGALLDGRKIGAFGNPVAFSFQATKNITSIEGGAVATTDAELAGAVRRLARSGLDISAWERFGAGSWQQYDAVSPGFKLAMSDVQAALAVHQLPHLDAWIETRARQWRVYDEALDTLPLRTPPATPARMRHARHLYQVTVGDSAPVNRDELARRLAKNGIGTGIHYRALHLHRYFRDRYGLRGEDFPVATDASANLLSLPIGPAYSAAQQAAVIESLRTTLTS